MKIILLVLSLICFLAVEEPMRVHEYAKKIGQLPDAVMPIVGVRSPNAKITKDQLHALNAHFGVDVEYESSGGVAVTDIGNLDPDKNIGVKPSTGNSPQSGDSPKVGDSPQSGDRPYTLTRAAGFFTKTGRRLEKGDTITAAEYAQLTHSGKTYFSRV